MQKVTVLTPFNYKNISQGNFEAVNVQDIALTATLHEPQAITDAGAGYMSRSMCLMDSGPLKGRLLLAAWDHGITQVCGCQLINLSVDLKYA